MNEEARRRELADFLRSRRDRLSPEVVGLPPRGRRRTPGLRREDVAELADVSTTWYTWLEQARDVRPSAALLERLASGLRLVPAERRHLFLLAGLLPPPPAPPDEEAVGPTLRRVLDAFASNPAYALGRRWDRLAWNRAAAAVFDLADAPPPHGRNLVWRVFTRPARGADYERWAGVAQRILAEFRADSARYPGDPWFAGLIDDLQRVSPEFRDWWQRHDVRGAGGGPKEFAHPAVGRLVLEHTRVQLPEAPELKIVVYPPRPEADTPAKLARLLAGA